MGDGRTTKERETIIDSAIANTTRQLSTCRQEPSATSDTATELATDGATDSVAARLDCNAPAIFKAFDHEDGLVLATLCKVLEGDVRLMLGEVHKNDKALQQLK